MEKAPPVGSIQSTNGSSEGLLLNGLPWQICFLSTSQRGKGAKIGDGTERWRERRAKRGLPDEERETCPRRSSFGLDFFFPLR